LSVLTRRVMTRFDADYSSFCQVFLLGIALPSAILSRSPVCVLLFQRNSLRRARNANFKEEERFLLKIRLTLMGSKKKPKYRIVVIEKSRARDGRYVDILGQYDPKKNPAALNLNKEKYAHWVSKGAQPSNTVKSFLAKVS